MRIAVLGNVSHTARRHAATGSAGAAAAQEERVVSAGAIGSAVAPRRAVEIPRTPKKPARAVVETGSAKAPGAAVQDVQEKAQLRDALVAGGIAEAPERGVVGCAAAPETRGRAGAIDESSILGLPSLLAACKKTDLGWTLSREQILQMAESKFLTPETGMVPRRRSSLVGIT